MRNHVDPKKSEINMYIIPIDIVSLILFYTDKI